MIEERSNILFIDKFKILDLNQDHMNDNVFRIHCKGQDSKADLILDIYQPFLNFKGNLMFKLILMEIDNDKDDDKDDDKEKDKLFKRYNYVMTGKVFKKEMKNVNSINLIAIYASFGGLLLRLQADPNYVNHLSIDQEIYLLIKSKKS